MMSRELNPPAADHSRYKDVDVHVIASEVQLKFMLYDHDATSRWCQWLTRPGSQPHSDFVVLGTFSAFHEHPIELWQAL
jgi:hypothetical protein